MDKSRDSSKATTKVTTHTHARTKLTHTRYARQAMRAGAGCGHAPQRVRLSLTSRWHMIRCLGACSLEFERTARFWTEMYAMNASKGSAGGMMDSAIKKLTEMVSRTQTCNARSTARELGSPSNAAELCVLRCLACVCGVDRDSLRRLVVKRWRRQRETRLRPSNTSCPIAKPGHPHSCVSHIAHGIDSAAASSFLKTFFASRPFMC